ESTGKEAKVENMCRNLSSPVWFQSLILKSRVQLVVNDGRACNGPAVFFESCDIRASIRKTVSTQPCQITGTSFDQSSVEGRPLLGPRRLSAFNGRAFLTA